MSAVVDWDDDDDTELCYEDDGFVYRRKRRRGPREQPSASVPALPDLERDLTRWRRNNLLKLKDRYRKETHRWELLSNSLRAMEDKTTQVAEEYVDATATHLVETQDSAARLIDELLAKANAQEAAISHVSNLCDLAESVCSDLEEQWSKSYTDLAAWSSPHREFSEKLDSVLMWSCMRTNEIMTSYSKVTYGIIHRDLKPENLILTADHKIFKLADFGLAREESLTKMMTPEIGTYRWMAPELYSTVSLRQGEKKHYNHKVDAHSFAIVLWELIHNKLPFQGMSNLQAAYAAAFKNVRPCCDDLPEDLECIVTSCWKEDPNSRPNFTQIIHMLFHYLSTVTPPETAIPPHMFASKSPVFLPESPGTSALMAARDTENTTSTGNKLWGFCICSNNCY